MDELHVTTPTIAAVQAHQSHPVGDARLGLGRLQHLHLCPAHLKRRIGADVKRSLLTGQRQPHVLRHAGPARFCSGKPAHRGIHALVNLADVGIAERAKAFCLGGLANGLGAGRVHTQTSMEMLKTALWTALACVAVLGILPLYVWGATASWRKALQAAKEFGLVIGGLVAVGGGLGLLAALWEWLEH
ncbi:MAG: hypothetical protein ACRC1H_17685 [Caldilineaceae bacterium]